MEIKSIIAAQRHYFESGTTLPVARRLEYLEKFRSAIQARESEILEALRLDLNKVPFEGYMTEVGMVLDDLHFAIKHLRRWAKPRTAPTPMAQFPAKSFILAEPYGVALIMAPWNYPFQLALEPLTGAIAAGCCVVLKPSAYAPATSGAIARLIASVFPPEYVTVVEGGREANQLLLTERFDYIFFTGSVEVGKYVMECASKHLTPISLELGGKSPALVERTADLALSAKRLAFGKCLNAGQTCVAPDYLLIQKGCKKRFLAELTKAISAFFPGGDYSTMGTIVNQKHFERLLGLIKGQHVVFGGQSDAERRWIAPTILDDVSWDAPVMREEIFGPILPVLTYDTLEEAMALINARPKPLAFYLFTRDRAVEDAVFSRVSFGGGCINDTVIHLATPHMGFGGVGESGMGSYHGKLSFDTFTHYKSIVKKHLFLDMPMRYRPYTERNFKFIRMFLK